MIHLRLSEARTSCYWRMPDRSPGPVGRVESRLARPTRIWQGADDNNVPPEATVWLAGRIPGAELTILAGAGHSMTEELWPEVFGWLLGRTGSPR